MKALIDGKMVRVKVLNDDGKCPCEGWGCMECCETEAEARAMQGVYG